MMHTAWPRRKATALGPERKIKRYSISRSEVRRRLKVKHGKQFPKELMIQGRRTVSWTADDRQKCVQGGKGRETNPNRRYGKEGQESTGKGRIKSG